MSTLIILDNGHGQDTAGKRSPVWADGSQLFEWEFNRDIVKRIAEQLNVLNIPYVVIVPDTLDVPLKERCRRANSFVKKHNGDAVLFSIHGNAGGGTGWEAYTSKGRTKADDIARELYSQAGKEFGRDGWKLRKDMTDGDDDKEADFYILKHTLCPAILSENFFMDNEKDCHFMMTEEGRARIAKIHVETIKKIEL